MNLCLFIATASKNHVEMSLGRPSLELIKESAWLQWISIGLVGKTLEKRRKELKEMHGLNNQKVEHLENLAVLGSAWHLAEVAEKLLKDIVPAGAPQET